MLNKHSRQSSLVLLILFFCFCIFIFSFKEIYRIVSQRQMPDSMGANGNGGTGSSHVPIRLPPTNPVSDSKQNTSCCS
jgi:hypothetical protein